MIKFLITLIILILILQICALCAAGGFYFGLKFKSDKKSLPPQKPPEPTENEKRKAKRERLEYENMLSYVGEEQKSIEGQL